ncbi:MAG: Na+/H+ antiporter subunit E [Thermoplasmatota archaeon]
MLLVAGSGDIDTFFFNIEEVVAGAILSLLAAGIARAMLGKAENTKMFNPLKWLMFIFYVVVIFLPSLTIANIDVAYRVITGRIRPGIVRIKPHLKTDLGRTILANSITLTPGTLTVDVEEKSGDLFVHWINVKETETEEGKLEAVCGKFARWARRLSE